METLFIIVAIMYILLLFVFVVALKMGFPLKWGLGIAIVTGALMLEYLWIGVLLAALIAFKYLPAKTRPAIILIAVVIVFGIVQTEKSEEKRDAKQAAANDSAQKEKTAESIDQPNKEDLTEEQITEDTTQTPVEEVSNQGEVDTTYNENPMQNQELHDAVVNYGYSLVQAINDGDFSIVEPYLLPDSNLYFSQVALVEKLFSQNVTESLYEFDVTSAVEISENTYEIETFEDTIVIKNGNEESKQFRWVYTVEYVNGQYFLSDIKSPVQ